MKAYRAPLAFAIFAFVLMAIYFFPGLGGEKLLASGDHGYAALVLNHHALPAFYHEGWTKPYWLGWSTGVIDPSVATVLAKTFPASLAYHAMLAVPLFLFTIFAFLFFQRRLGSSVPAALAAVAMAYTPIHVSYVCAGHLSKLGSIAFFPLVLYFLDRALEGKKQIISLILAGFGLGLAFLQGETPVTLYFAVLATAWYLWRALGTPGQEPKKRLRAILLFALVPLFTLPFSADVFVSQYFGIAKSKTAGEVAPTLPQSMNPAGGWDWATQWSFPPEETADLLVGGLFGVKSGDPEKPYWGRTGQQPGWTPENRQGMQNLSQTSSALGLFLVLFALYALIRVRGREVSFWLAIFILSLLLAFGRHVPVYALIYHLPFLDKFRNPNRFLHLVHFAAAMLAAYGLGGLWNDLKAQVKDGLPRPKLPLLWKVLPWAGVGLTLLALIVIGANKTSLQAFLEARWGMDAAERMAGNLTTALWVFLFLFPAAWALIAWAQLWGGKSNLRLGVVFSVLALALMLDQARLNAPYFDWNPKGGWYEPDALSKLIKERTKVEPGRIRYLTRSYYLHRHLNDQLLLADLESVDITAASRYPDDLATYMRLAPQDLRGLRLWNARYLVADQPYMIPEPGRATGGLMPKWQIPDPFQRGAFAYVYEDEGALPRAYLAHQGVKADTVEEVFAYFRAPGFNPRETVILTHKPDNAELTARFPEKTKPGATNLDLVTLVKHVEDKVEIKVAASEKGMLVLSDGYHGNWKATVDGKPTPVHRAQYLMRGVYVESGEHTVRFTFESSPIWPIAGFTSWGAFAALLFLFVRKRKGEGEVVKT